MGDLNSVPLANLTPIGWKSLEEYFIKFVEDYASDGDESVPDLMKDATVLHYCDIIDDVRDWIETHFTFTTTHQDLDLSGWKPANGSFIDK